MSVGRTFQAELATELARLVELLRRIRVPYSGPDGTDSVSVAEWDEVTNLNCILRSGPAGELNFVQAWHTATSQLRSVIFDHFVPWAARVIESGDVASLPEIPDPPADVLPLAANEAGGILSRIIGTADTVVAGTRIIFWAAAYVNPTALRRAEDHRILFWRWTGKMLQAGGSVRVSEPVIAAIQSAFVRLTADSSGGRAPASPPRDPALRFVLRRIGPERFFVEFGTEQGEISGIGASRFARLCRFGTHSPVDLARDQNRIAESRSVVTQESADSSSPSARRSRRRSRRPEAMIQQVRNQLEEIEAHLQTGLSEERRTLLETQREDFQRYLNDQTRRPDSTARTARRTVERSLERLADQVEPHMPALAGHIRDCIRFDDGSGQFIYSVAGQTAWEFVDFV